MRGEFESEERKSHTLELDDDRRIILQYVSAPFAGVMADLLHFVSDDNFSGFYLQEPA